jgi:hypothetical protein
MVFKLLLEDVRQSCYLWHSPTSLAISATYLAIVSDPVRVSTACIHLKWCSSVDVEFTLTKQEADAMKYISNDEENQIITLCDIIQCWTEPNSDALLVHTVQTMSGNKKTLLVKKKYKMYIIHEILQVFETLE